jgi:hypothetical protein
MNWLRRGEYHAFDGGGAKFLYLVPSAAVVRVDDLSQAILDAIGEQDVPVTDVATSLSARWQPAEIRDSIH